jgi:hypothetical protein
MIDWARIERGKNDAVAKAAQSLPEVKPGKVAPPWPTAKKFPDISQLDFGDATLQTVSIKTLLASTKTLNKAKLVAHIQSGAAPIRTNPFTTPGPLLTKTKQGLVIVDGHHRLAAMQMLGTDSVKLWVVPAT